MNATYTIVPDILHGDSRWYSAHDKRNIQIIISQWALTTATEARTARINCMSKKNQKGFVFHNGTPPLFYMQR